MSKPFFFEKIFWLNNINIEVVIRIAVIFLKNIVILKKNKSFPYNFYNTIEALLITQEIKIMNKHQFIQFALGKNSFKVVIHVVV